MKRVLVKGFFENNFGDDLFLKVLIERYPNVKFYLSSTSNYDYFLKKYKNVFVYKKFHFIYVLKTIMNKIMSFFKLNKVYRIENFLPFDKIVIITGSLFMETEDFDFEKTKSNYEFKGVDYYILGCNFGPYKSKKFLDLHMNDIYKNAKDVCFRDNYSYNIFCNKLSNVRHAPDIVFNLDISNLLVKKSKTVVFSIMNCNKDNTKRISDEMYISKSIEMIEYFLSEGYSIKLVSFSRKQGDEIIIKKILEKISNENISEYFYRGNIDECLDYLADSEIIVGTRFHANILGLLLGKKIVPISYSKKTNDALFEIGYDGNIVLLSNLDNFDISKTIKSFNNNIDINKIIKKAEEQFKELDIDLK